MLGDHSVLVKRKNNECRIILVYQNVYQVSVLENHIIDGITKVYFYSFVLLIKYHTFTCFDYYTDFLVLQLLLRTPQRTN